MAGRLPREDHGQTGLRVKSKLGFAGSQYYYMHTGRDESEETRLRLALTTDGKAV